MNDLPFKLIQETELEKWRADSFWTKEIETLKWIESFDKDAIFMDIGANIGIYSLYCAHLYLNAKIYAFEPHKGNYQRLLRNAEINEFTNIFAYQIALSNGNCDEIFYIPNETIGNTGGQVGRTIDEYGRQFSPASKEKVTVMTVDLWIATMGIVPNYIKIDVDGQEDKIIEGMAATLTNKALKGILVEVNNRRNFIINRIVKSGFTALNHFNFMKDHSRVRRKREGIKAENIVFVRE